MVPPDNLFGVIPTWAALYPLTLTAFGTAGYLLYRRVFRLILLGRPADRFDQPIRRIVDAIPLIFGQRKVLQRVSLRCDLAGLAHFFIFWGFLSFTASYVVFIFGDAAWPHFSKTILTETGVRGAAIYLDLLATIFLGCSRVGRHTPLGNHAPTPQLRPDPEVGVGDHPPAHSGADGCCPS